MSNIGRNITWRGCWPVLALLTVHAAAAAQQGAGGTGAEDSIVVTGKRGKDSRTQTFVDAIAAPSRSGQLARFADDICPRSFGLRDADNSQLAARIGRVAAAAGIGVAGGDCRPNIIILFVPDRQQAIAHWRTRRPDFFDGLSPVQLNRLAKGNGPVAAWQIVHVKGAGGRPMAKTDADGQDYLVNMETRPSRLTSSVEMEFYASFLLIEQKAIGNASVTQLADYAAMRTLASTDAAAGAGQALPTILSLFTNADAAVPLSVTQWDLSYLSALYKARLASQSSAQRRSMAKEIRNAASRVED